MQIVRDRAKRTEIWDHRSDNKQEHYTTEILQFCKFAIFSKKVLMSETVEARGKWMKLGILYYILLYYIILYNYIP